MSRKIMTSRLSSILAVATALFGGLAAGEAPAQQSTAATPVKVLRPFTAPSSDEDKKPRGISGMACLGKAADVSRECFVINDEERAGEVAILTKEGLTPQGPGKLVTFIKEGDKGEKVVGTAPKPMCKDKDGKVDTKGKFGELDGEGVAIAGDFVYVASSHACSGGGKFKPSSFLLTRFKLNSATSFRGDSDPLVERSWRLADVLLAADKVIHDAFGKPKDEGTNIEGIAVIGDRLYAGLRTPVRAEATATEATAFIVSAPVEALFAPGDKPLDPAAVKKTVKTKSVKLGPGAGIRDLAALKSGKLLILSGPTESQDVPYQLWLLDQPDSDDDSDKLRHQLVTITTSQKGAKDETAKAETVVVIDEDSKKLKVLVLYDNIDEGAPMQHEVTLP